MSSHQVFFESSYQIDIGNGASPKHLGLSSANGDPERQARLLLEELRRRLRSNNGVRLEMSQESKQRIIEGLTR